MTTKTKMKMTRHIVCPNCGKRLDASDPPPTKQTVIELPPGPGGAGATGPSRTAAIGGPPAKDSDDD